MRDFVIRSRPSNEELKYFFSVNKSGPSSAQAAELLNYQRYRKYSFSKNHYLGQLKARPRQTINLLERVEVSLQNYGPKNCSLSRKLQQALIRKKLDFVGRKRIKTEKTVLDLPQRQILLSELLDY